MPTVSIGMPVYARPEFLKLAVESLLAQTFEDFELILSDDASADPRVQAVCEEFAARDKRIQYVRQAKNLGAFANHLYVLERAVAPLFIWVSEDDLWKPTFLARGVAALSADPHKSGWLAQVQGINHSGAVYQVYPPFTRFASRGDKRRELAQFLFEPEILGKSDLFHSLFRRKAILDLIRSGFWQDGAWGADVTFVYAFLCRYDFAIDPELLFFKRADTNKPARVRRWPRRHIYPLRKTGEYFVGYRAASAGTPYAAMTRRLLPLRFLYDRVYKLVTVPLAVVELVRRAIPRQRAKV